MILNLPWPPSLNKYWRHVGAKVLISERGREYRQEVAFAVLQAGRPSIDGRLHVAIQAYPPDRRVRDLDNLFKSVLDALKHAKVYEDDSQIDRLEIERCAVLANGALSVRIQPFANREVCRGAVGTI